MDTNLNTHAPKKPFYFRRPKKQKARLKRNTLRRASNPRYHSNYGKNVPSLCGFCQTLCFYAAIRKESTCKMLSVLRLRSDKSLERTAIASHQPATLCKHHIPTVFVIVFFVIFKFYVTHYTIPKSYCQDFLQKKTEKHPCRKIFLIYKVFIIKNIRCKY